MNQYPAVAEIDRASPVVHISRELAVDVDGSARSATDVLRLLADAGIDVLAHCCYRNSKGANLLAVLENAQEVCGVIRAAGYSCQTNPILWVACPYRVGLGASLRGQLEEWGINILYTYVSWGTGQQAVFVFRTTRDELAFRILHAAFKNLDVNSARDAAPQRCSTGTALGICR